MITFVVSWYKQYPVVLGSLLTQTNTNWKAIVIHDGPVDPLWEAYSQLIVDPRVEYHCTDKRYNDTGHSLRAFGLALSKSEYTICTNADNYYLPNFVNEFIRSGGGHLGAYCNMLHSHWIWGYREGALEYSRVDCGSIMIRTSVMQEIGWQSGRFQADWDFVLEVMAKYGSNDIIKIDKTLFVHN